MDALPFAYEDADADLEPFRAARDDARVWAAALTPLNPRWPRAQAQLDDAQRRLRRALDFVHSDAYRRRARRLWVKRVTRQATAQFELDAGLGMELALPVPRRDRSQRHAPRAPLRWGDPTLLFLRPGRGVLVRFLAYYVDDAAAAPEAAQRALVLIAPHTSREVAATDLVAAVP